MPFLHLKHVYYTLKTSYITKPSYAQILQQEVNFPAAQRPTKEFLEKNKKNLNAVLDFRFWWMQVMYRNHLMNAIECIQESSKIYDRKQFIYKYTVKNGSSLAFQLPFN